jgi:hypothetical protein
MDAEFECEQNDTHTYHLMCIGGHGKWGLWEGGSRGIHPIIIHGVHYNLLFTLLS